MKKKTKNVVTNVIPYNKEYRIMRHQGTISNHWYEIQKKHLFFFWKTLLVNERDALELFDNPLVFSTLKDALNHIKKETGAFTSKKEKLC